MDPVASQLHPPPTLGTLAVGRLTAVLGGAAVKQAPSWHVPSGQGVPFSTNISRKQPSLAAPAATAHAWQSLPSPNPHAESQQTPSTQRNVSTILRHRLSFFCEVLFGCGPTAPRRIFGTHLDPSASGCQVMATSSDDQRQDSADHGQDSAVGFLVRVAIR